MFITLIYVLVALAIAGLLLWGIDQFPIDATIKRMMHVFVIITVAVYVILALLGLLGLTAPLAPGPYFWRNR